MKKLYTVFLIIIAISFNLQGQSFYMYGDKTFGGGQEDFEGNMINIGNYQFLLGGSTTTFLNGDVSDPLCDSTSQDLWILKIDTAFNIIWQNAIGGSLGENFPKLQKAGSNFIVSSISTSDSSCDKTQNKIGNGDYWMYYGDFNNNVILNKTIGSLLDENNCTTIQLSTGDFIFGGSTLDSIGGDKTVPNFGNRDFWIVKCDLTGNKVWDKVYGGSSNENSSNDFFDLIPDDSGSFVFTGHTSSPLSGNISQSGLGSSDFWIVKCDSNGAIMWDKRYGGSGGDLPRKIMKCNDSGYIVCGRTFSPLSGDVSESPIGNRDVWVIKLDSLGNKQWDKRYGGTLLNDSWWVEQDLDGGYVIGGTTNSNIGGHVTENPSGQFDYWVFKIDTAGTKIWDKRFGGPGINQFRSLAVLPDTSIMLFGTADSGSTATKTDPGKGISDYWVVHFKYGEAPNGLPDMDETMNFEILPNPSMGQIQLPNSCIGSEITIYDAIGKLVFHQKYVSNNTLKLENLSPGYYVINFHFESYNIRVNKRLILQN